MRILQLIPGSGGTFYCQNCLRDFAQVRALRRHGHTVTVTPLYLPHFDALPDVAAQAPIFFGGVSMYLRELFPFFRKAPRWMDRLLDARWLLRRAAAREGTTNAADLGPMTLSMLDGPKGNQRKEYARFAAWLGAQERPDIIHISNALLLGFVPAIREIMDVPLVCSLQDEEPWVDGMRAPHDALCWERMAAHAAHVNGFVATSRWYADRMIARLRVPPERMAVIYPGIDVDRIAPLTPAFDPPAIGFLSRLNAEQGFGDLVDAFLKLKAEPALARLRLAATGGATPANALFLEGIEKRLEARGFLAEARIERHFHTVPQADFFTGLTVLSTPVHGGEAFGMQLIEALARGIPIVQPRAGAYTEIVTATGGGLLYDPEDPNGLVDALRAVLADPGLAQRLGGQGREAVIAQFNTDRVAREIIAAYARAGDVRV